KRRPRSRGRVGIAGGGAATDASGSRTAGSGLGRRWSRAQCCVPQASTATTSQVIAPLTWARNRGGMTTEQKIPRWLRFVLISDRAGSAWYIGAGFFFAPVLA